MTDIIKGIEKRIEKAFRLIEAQVLALFSKEQLSIVFTKNDFIPNTLLFCCLEFEINEATSDDSGLSLSFSMQRYDPSSDIDEVSEQYIFIVADLTTSTGSIIEDSGIKKVGNDNFEELETVIDEVLQFIERQKTPIIDQLNIYKIRAEG
ncbi:MAG TPA: hypothetical protein VF490_14020 [Chryseosolibacter sp.]